MCYFKQHNCNEIFLIRISNFFNLQFANKFFYFSSVELFRLRLSDYDLLKADILKLSQAAALNIL